jgi:hypothetical protein
MDGLLQKYTHGWMDGPLEMVDGLMLRFGECRWAMEQNVTLSRFLNLLVSFSYPSTVLHGPWIVIDRVQGKQQSIHGQARSLYFVGLS